MHRAQVRQLNGRHHGSGLDSRFSMPSERSDRAGERVSDQKRERQRQEARYNREKLAASADKHESPVKFEVVRKSPNSGQGEGNQVSKVLGNYYQFVKQGGSNHMMGVYQQPPTPAPSTAVHNTDTYVASPTPPPATTTSISSSSAAGSGSQRSHHNGVMRPPRPASGGMGTVHAHNVRHFGGGDIKDALKSGPGPGPGLPHHTQSVPPEPGAVRKGDVDIEKIKSMMTVKDLPFIPMLQTPRPDDHSTFTFPPAPRSSPSQKAPEGAASSSITTSNISSKAGRSSELKNKHMKYHMNSSSLDDVELSEESEDECNTQQSAKKTDSASSTAVAASSTVQCYQATANMDEIRHPSRSASSPSKSSDESSNSEASSGSDSEETSSNSSEDEAAQPAQPSSPPAEVVKDQNDSWSLTTIFQQSVPKSDTSQPSSVKNENYTDTKEKQRPLSPHGVDEPAPPILTTGPGMPSHLHKRVSCPASTVHKTHREGNLVGRLQCGSHSSDTSSDEGERIPSKPAPQVSADVRRLSRHSPLKGRTSLPIRRELAEPNLSSDSEDEAPKSKSKGFLDRMMPTRQEGISPKDVASQQKSKGVSEPCIKSPVKDPKRGGAAWSCGSLNAKGRPSYKDRKVKSARKLLSDSDSDVSVNVDTSSPEKCRTKSTFTPVSSTKAMIAEVQRESPSHSLNDRKTKLPPSQFKEPPAAGQSAEDDRKSSRGRMRSGQKDAVMESSMVSGKMQAACDNTCKKSRRNSRQKVDVETRDMKKFEPIINAIDRVSGDSLTSTSPLTGCHVPSSSRECLDTHSRVPVHYENGVPKLLCTVPLSLIDRVPPLNQKVPIKEEKLNKEVLKMRTSEKVVKAKSGRDSENSCKAHNEDETKRIAILSIFSKRQNSLEPDKVKREEEKSTLSQSRLQVEASGRRSKDMKEETCKGMVSPNVGLSSSRQRHPSASSHSSQATNTSSSGKHISRKHKKDKRKERSQSHEHTKEKKSERNSSLDREQDVKKTSRLLGTESNIAASMKREHEREGSYESTRTSYHPSKKLRVSPTSGHEDCPVSPHVAVASPRVEPNYSSTGKRSTSATPHGSDPSQHQQTYLHVPKNGNGNLNNSSQYPVPHVGSSVPFDNRGRTQERESEEDSPAGDGRSSVQGCYSREKMEESRLGPNGGDTSEYASLPSSEHESRLGGCYKGGVEYTSHSSPLIGSLSLHCSSALLSTGATSSSDPCYPHQFSSQEGLGNLQKVHYSLFERHPPLIDKDYMKYLAKAKELKHLADPEKRMPVQCMMYLDAATYFILSGISMGNDPGTSASSLKMYEQTLSLIKYLINILSAVFKKDSAMGDLTYVKLAVLSLRCQSLLSVHLYGMKKALEPRGNARQLSEYVHNVNTSKQQEEKLRGCGGQSIGGTTPSAHPNTSQVAGSSGSAPCGSSWSIGQQRSATSPSSMSPTPSPAGSVGSEGSLSSGYSTEGNRHRGGGNGGPHPPLGLNTPPQTARMVSIPQDIHSLFVDSYQIAVLLCGAWEAWREADTYIYKYESLREFFIELDHQFGALTLHSFLNELVIYVQGALEKLRLQVP